jgi:hypothetical protein
MPYKVTEGWKAKPRNADYDPGHGGNGHDHDHDDHRDLDLWFGVPPAPLLRSEECHRKQSHQRLHWCRDFGSEGQTQVAV